MSRSNEEDTNQAQLGRRKFLRIGGLGAAAIAAGAAARPEVTPGTDAPAELGQTPPAQTPPAQGQAAQAPGRLHRTNGISIRFQHPSRR